jgi:phospholipid-binding lipoprotein MlaA
MISSRFSLALYGRQVVATVAVVGAVALTGCASTEATHPQDPFEGYNRAMTTFNENVDKAVLKPVATGYQTVVPSPLRTGVTNFFGNLGDLWSMVNFALQGNGEKAYEHMVRFTTNTVFGLGGVLDWATPMQIKRDKQDFGMTLGHWGVKPGPYLVLPFLGPSTVRDTVALPADWWGHPVDRMHPVSTRNSLIGLRIVNTRANLLNATDTLEAASLDRYALMRDFYLKQRDVSAKQVDDENAGRVESYDD